MKRQMKKKLAALLSLILILSLALAGCKKKEEIPEPHRLAEAYYLLFTRGNTEELIKYGNTESEAKNILDTYKTSMQSKFKRAANSSGGIFKTEDTDKVLNALLHAMAKLKYEVKTEEIDEKKGTATVILKSQSVPLSDIQTKLMNNMQKAMKTGEITDQYQMGSYFLNETARLIKNSKPTKEMKETVLDLKLKTVKINKKEVKRWMPENSYTFETEIGKLFTS